MEQSTRTPRKSLTRKQLEEPVALDLLALLQTVTSDGRLLEPEILAIKEWLEENRNSTLPAIEYLRDSVQTVLADGRVTEMECVWLQKVVETVLPKEQRDLAVLRRREAIADERRQVAAEKERIAEIQRRSRPIATFDVMVAGVLYEERAATISRFVTEGDVVYLAREPKNPYSPNAISVLLQQGYDIGYVPETEAVRLAPLLDGGALHAAAIKKVLHGGRAPFPVVWGELYSPDAEVSDAVGPAQIPPRRCAPAPQPPPAIFARGATMAQPKVAASKSGCLAIVVAVVVVFLLVT